MPSPKSQRGEARRRQKPEDSDGSSEGENSRSPQNKDRSNSHRNTSGYAYVSPRSDLSHHSDLNSSAETYKHTSRLNTSTSSDSVSPERTGDRSTSKSPNLYPSLNSFCESDKSMNSSQEVTQNNTSSWLPVCVILAILIFLVMLFSLYSMSSNICAEPDSIEGPVPPFHRFTGFVSSLEELLPNQNKRLWRTVKASAKHVLNDAQSDYPVVILMAAPIKYAPISKCIAKKIADNFELSLGLTPGGSVGDMGKIKYLDPPLQKEKLDEQLHSTFSYSQKKSFVIDNLQLLHPEAALMLHGYCDNDNAPYKDVMMVLLLYVDKDEVGDYNSASIESYLEHLWSRGLEVDKVKALLSRVANNIVTVEMEDEETLRKVCR